MKIQFSPVSYIAPEMEIIELLIEHICTTSNLENLYQDEESDW